MDATKTTAPATDTATAAGRHADRMCGPIPAGHVELVHSAGWASHYAARFYVLPITRTTKTMIVVAHKGVELRFRKSDGTEVGEYRGHRAARFGLLRF